jgi:hypothetical protein
MCRWPVLDKNAFKRFVRRAQRHGSDRFPVRSWLGEQLPWRIEMSRFSFITGLTISAKTQTSLVQAFQQNLELFPTTARQSAVIRPEAKRISSTFYQTALKTLRRQHRAAHPGAAEAAGARPAYLTYVSDIGGDLGDDAFLAQPSRSPASPQLRCPLSP